MPEIVYEIKENIGVISESSRGWTREVNMVSWNGRDPKVDIRDWSPEKDKMGKGITLTADECKKLRDLLNAMTL
jgi:hypothetical protein